MIKKYFLIAFLATTGACAMDFSDKNSWPPLSAPVTSWEKAERFCNKVVVYSVDNDYHFESPDFPTYVLDRDNPASKIGFVDNTVPDVFSRNGMHGYPLVRLFHHEWYNKKDAEGRAHIPASCILATCFLKKAGLVMREATREEKAKVVRVLDSRWADWEELEPRGLGRIYEALRQQ